MLAYTTFRDTTIDYVALNFEPEKVIKSEKIYSDMARKTGE